MASQQAVLGSAPDLAALLRSDEVNARLYTDREIFALERRMIWTRLWIYVGHESEIPQPGDYRRRSIGTEPVVMTRDQDGEIHVLVNRCSHRGNTVCQLAHGNSNTFRCQYHGWTFANDGRLVGVPFRGGYGEGFIASQPGLSSVAVVESYRGLIFAKLTPSVLTLKEYLGGAAQAIDRFVDLSPSGEIEVSAGMHQTRFRGNWKMWSENSLDRYHANFVHQAAYRASAAAFSAAATKTSGDDSLAVVRCYEHGHAELDFRPERRRGGERGFASQGAKTERDFPEYVSALEDRYGKAEAGRILTEGSPHVFVFPNLFLLQQDIRCVIPVDVDQSLSVQYPALLKGPWDELNFLRLQRHQHAYGPAGAIMPDDLEIFERNQAGLSGESSSWLVLARGEADDRIGPDGYPEGHVASELGIRHIWAEYAKHMGAGEDD